MGDADLMALTDSQMAALIGALVGSGIAVVSQCAFIAIEARRQARQDRRALARQRLDEFYSPMLTRLLEIEYKLWLDNEARKTLAAGSGAGGDGQSKEQLAKKWDDLIFQEIDQLDHQIVDLFRRKRWLAFDSTVSECQRLIRFLEATKLAQLLPVSEITDEWGDVTKLKELHRDVRKHHDQLMEELDLRSPAIKSLLPEGSSPDGPHDQTALKRYIAHLEGRNKDAELPGSTSQQR
jgi:hypothetical protein